MGEDVCEMASEASASMCHAVTTQSGVERLSNAELSAFSYSGLCHQLFSTQRSGAAALNSHVLWNAHQRLFSASGRRAFASALNDQRSKSTALDRFAFDMLERLFITALHESRRHQTDGNLSAAQQTDEVETMISLLVLTSTFSRTSSDGSKHFLQSAVRCSPMLHEIELWQHLFQVSFQSERLRAGLLDDKSQTPDPSTRSIDRSVLQSFSLPLDELLELPDDSPTDSKEESAAESGYGVNSSRAELGERAAQPLSGELGPSPRSGSAAKPSHHSNTHTPCRSASSSFSQGSVRRPRAHTFTLLKHSLAFSHIGSFAFHMVQVGMAVGQIQRFVTTVAAQCELQSEDLDLLLANLERFRVVPPPGQPIARVEPAAQRSGSILTRMLRRLLCAREGAADIEAELSGESSRSSSGTGRSGTVSSSRLSHSDASALDAQGCAWTVRAMLELDGGEMIAIAGETIPLSVIDHSLKEVSSARRSAGEGLLPLVLVSSVRAMPLYCSWRKLHVQLFVSAPRRAPHLVMFSSITMEDFFANWRYVAADSDSVYVFDSRTVDKWSTDGIAGDDGTPVHLRMEFGSSLDSVSIRMLVSAKRADVPKRLCRRDKCRRAQQDRIDDLFGPGLVVRHEVSSRSGEVGKGSDGAAALDDLLSDLSGTANRCSL